MKRKLVSIQKIISLKQIPNADRIEVAEILGWNVVVPKGQFKVKDMCCYFETDSLLPKADWNEFLFKGTTKDKVRLKTIKLRGCISQGLAMPTSIVPVEPREDGKPFYQLGMFQKGMDITEIMEVEKYDPPIPAQLQGTAKGYRPSFIPKTDETRIQAVPQVLERHKGKIFVITEKLDGASMSFYLNNDEFGVCSREINLKETEGNTLWKVTRQLHLEEKLRLLKKNLAIQGELHGEGIQGNKYKLKGQDFAVFDIYDIDKMRYLNVDEMNNICHLFELKTVPILDSKYILGTSIESLVEYSKGKSKLNSNTEREGIVLRPLVEERDSDLGRLSFKVISPSFLIQYGE